MHRYDFATGMPTVVLSKRRINFLRDLMAATAGAEPFAWCVEQTASDIGRSQMVLSLPHEGWLLAIELLSEHVYGERGFRRPNLADYKADMLQVITQRVNEHIAHPAFRGMAAAGRHIDRFLCHWGGPNVGLLPQGDPALSVTSMAEPLYSHHPVVGAITRWIPTIPPAGLRGVVDPFALALQPGQWVRGEDPHRVEQLEVGQSLVEVDV